MVTYTRFPFSGRGVISVGDRVLVHGQDDHDRDQKCDGKQCESSIRHGSRANMNNKIRGDSRLSTHWNVVSTSGMLPVFQGLPINSPDRHGLMIPTTVTRRAR